MNSIFVALLSLVCLGAGYLFYSKILVKIWGVDPDRKTPAFERYDGIDYVPAKSWTILFGHHFASIAGAAPIIGPVIACAIWGWVPALIWIVIGSIFIGGVHDFSSLVSSLRYGGSSIANVSEQVISRRAKMFFATFIWFALILVVAVFAAVTAKTLVEEPRIVIPTFGLVLNGLLVGVMIYRWKWNQIVSTLLGIGILVGFLILGFYVPIELPFNNAELIWIYILLIYAYIASVIPVNILLQPRDYLATFILCFGLFFGYLGIVVSHPTMHTPPFIKWSAQSGPLWPMLFVFIACGAISGFHSLIASGTTSKQLPSEKYAKRIGYGGMIMEGILATLALITVSAGLYWKGWIGPSNLIYPELIKQGGWILTFATGFGNIVAPIFGMTVGMLIAVVMLNSFVMTTLDTATRINRYITEELLGEGLRVDIFKNRFFSTLLIIICAGYLAAGNYKLIWPIFGASNQLVAALVLIVVTTYLFSRGKPIRYTLYPAIFMLVTTIGALVVEIRNFLIGKNYLLTIIGIILLIMAIFMVFEAKKAVIRIRKK